MPSYHGQNFSQHRGQDTSMRSAMPEHRLQSPLLRGLPSFPQPAHGWLRDAHVRARSLRASILSSTGGARCRPPLPPPTPYWRSRPPLEGVAHPGGHVLREAEEKCCQPLVRRCRDLEAILERDRDSSLCHVCCPKSSMMLSSSWLAFGNVKRAAPGPSTSYSI